MKKLFLFILIIFPIKVFAISAESAVVLDSDSNRVLYCHNCTKEKLIASTTKIMTAIIAIENGNLDEKITADEEVLKAYGSAIYIQIGESLTLKELIYGLMLRSGNDAAILIANNISPNMQEFAKLMNEKATSLGMKNTIFYNSHGLEEENGKGNTSTAKDMALLMSYAIKNDIFKEITSTKNITVKSDLKTYVWQNKNKLLTTYKYTTGGKTGFTQKARRTLVTSATKDNKNLVVVTLNDGNDFQDHENLYEEYFNKYELYKVLDKNNFKLEETHYQNDQLYIKEDFQLLVTKEEKKLLNISVDLITKNHFKENEVVGKVKVLLNNEEIFSQPIFIIPKTKEHKESFWQKIWNFLKFW